MKKLINTLIFILIITAVSASTLNIELIDVYTGDSKDESGCIFEVNGEKGVVGYHDTEIINGVSIFVKEVYAVNKEAKDEDRCEYIYNVITAPETEGTKTLTETVGDEKVDFMLTARETSADDEEYFIATKKQIPEKTTVSINGMEVASVDDKDTASEKAVYTAEEKGLFSKLWNWLFG